MLKKNKNKKKQGKRKMGGMLLICLLAVMAGAGYEYAKTEKGRGVKVLGVLDGDTLTLEGKVRFRLRNIDAPETKYCGGREAEAELRKLIAGKRVRIEEEILDKWGRPMGYVYDGKKLINKEMLITGWAKYHADKTSRSDELKAISDKNKAERKGLFGRCWQREPTNKKCPIKANIDPSNQKVKRYYLPGCVQYNTTIVELDRGESWFCNEAEARAAGYFKSERCP